MFNKEYSIIFNTNGGKNIDNIKCKSKKDIPALPECVKSGYKFIGWFLDEGLEKEFNLEKMPKSDLVLYAKWEGISIEEFNKEINFFTKSANILQNLQNDYIDVPNFKDNVKKEEKPAKKKKSTKATTKKASTKKKSTKTSASKKENKELENVIEEDKELVSEDILNEELVNEVETIDEVSNEQESINEDNQVKEEETSTEVSE